MVTQRNVGPDGGLKCSFSVLVPDYAGQKVEERGGSDLKASFFVLDDRAYGLFHFDLSCLPFDSS